MERYQMVYQMVTYKEFEVSNNNEQQGFKKGKDRAFYGNNPDVGCFKKEQNDKCIIDSGSIFN